MPEWSDLHICNFFPRAHTAEMPFTVRYTTMHQVTAHRRYHIGPHEHKHYEILYVDRGHYRCAVNAVEIELDSPAVLVLKPGDVHEDHCGPGLRYRALWLRVEPGPSKDYSINVLRPDTPVAEQILRTGTAAVRSIAERLQEITKTGDPFTCFTQDALAGLLLWELLRILPRAWIDPGLLLRVTQHSVAQDITRVFQQQVDRHLGLSDLAHLLKLSPRTLTSRCAELFKTAPMKLFMRLKMERAQLLLQQSDLSVKEVSARLGFSNQYHFSKAYKRHFGTAPAHARRAATLPQ